jgi:hypothetical protein
MYTDLRKLFSSLEQREFNKRTKTKRKMERYAKNAEMHANKAAKASTAVNNAFISPNTANSLDNLANKSSKMEKAAVREGKLAIQEAQKLTNKNTGSTVVNKKGAGRKIVIHRNNGKVEKIVDKTKKGNKAIRELSVNSNSGLGKNKSVITFKGPKSDSFIFESSPNVSNEVKDSIKSAKAASKLPTKIDKSTRSISTIAKDSKIGGGIKKGLSKNKKLAIGLGIGAGIAAAGTALANKSKKN